MHRLRSYLLAAFFCLMACASCIDRPETILTDDQMVDLLVDIHRSEGLLELQQSQAHADPQYQQAVMASVLVKHGVTRAQYDSSLMWYAKHLKLFVRVYSHVEERLEEEHEAWNLQVAESRDFDISAAGDSVELWTLRDYLVLDSRLCTSVRFWEVKADSNYKAGDTLRWAFDVSHMAQGQKLMASMALRASEDDYANADSKYRDNMMTMPVGVTASLIEQDGIQQLEVVPDSMKHFSSVVLNLTMISPDSVQSPAFLRQVSLKRFHCHE